MVELVKLFDSLDQISKRSAFVLKVRVKEFGTNDLSRTHDTPSRCLARKRSSFNGPEPEAHRVRPNNWILPLFFSILTTRSINGSRIFLVASEYRQNNGILSLSRVKGTRKSAQTLYYLPSLFSFGLQLHFCQQSFHLIIFKRQDIKTLLYNLSIDTTRFISPWAFSLLDSSRPTTSKTRISSGKPIPMSRSNSSKTTP